MLFDYRKQTELVSLAGIFSWLETKDPEEEYNYADCHGACLFSQYLTDRMGVPAVSPYYLDDADPKGPLFTAWQDLHERYRMVAFGHPWTFGGALNRAREMAAWSA